MTSDMEAESNKTDSKNKAKSYADRYKGTVFFLFLIVGSYLSFKYIGGIDLAKVLKDLFLMKSMPQLGKDASLGIIFVLGLFTSFHCIGMCGGIAISQAIGRTGETETSRKQGKYSWLIPSALYNSGRVIGYTLVGSLVGGLGQAVSLSGRVKGLIPILGGVFMVLMGINLLGIFPVLRKLTIRMPYFVAKKLQKKNNYSPLYVGLLTALMPCGPLQIVQLYALGTRSFILGGLSSFIFALGTVPLLFAFGAVNTLINKQHTVKILKLSSVLVIILGCIMISRGLSLSGINLTLPQNSIYSSSNVSSIQADFQTVTTIIKENSYPAITVQKGIPVKWTIKVSEDKLNECNNEILIPEFNKDQKLIVGDNLVEFTPEKEGKFIYTCWMGMIKSRITVVSKKGTEDIKMSGMSEVIPEKVQDSEENSESQTSAVSTDKTAAEAESGTSTLLQENVSQTSGTLDYTEEETSAVSNIPAEMAEEKTADNAEKNVKFEGFLIDKHCFGLVNPAKETRFCLTMEECAASGYGIAVLQENGKYVFYPFDENGNILSSSLLNGIKRNTYFYISVSGIIENNIVKVRELIDMAVQK